MLELKSIDTAYGAKQVLFGVTLSVARGEVVSLMGRNGMGKTTTVHSIMGFCRARRGTIQFEQRDITRLPPHRVARCGIGLVPEGRQIFPNLTVTENLIATAANHRHVDKPWSLSRVHELFPRLHELRRNMASVLSGGEQQMLAIGRALMTNPSLLILDEATEGLAPLTRQEIWRCLERLKEAGQSILLIDKNVEALTHLADRHYILVKGKVAWEGNSTMLRRDPNLSRRFLGV
jgi:branched-chain amino acid transport system ATP-binding protein